MARTKRVELPRVTVSENRRYLVTENGEPFLWMGDTAWELFHRLKREEAETYFANRQANGFNVIQAVALAELDGLNTANREGRTPFIDNDPGYPNDAYFRLVDMFIEMAAAHQLYIALLPTWGDKVAHLWGEGPVVFTPETIYRYGLFLGRRYQKKTNLIWVMGGDRPVAYTGRDGQPYDDLEMYRALARGVREGLGNVPAVFTFHPNGGHSSSHWLQNEPWLDVHMMQSGHGGGHDVPVWEMIEHDYQLDPTRPVLDGEPNYEDHPVNPWPSWDPGAGYYSDYDVRKQLYRSVFAGACGVTYGHHSIWQMFETWRTPITFPCLDWREALDRPGARQVRHLRALMESRPYLSRVPDQGLLASEPGERGNHVQATRAEDGAYAFIYLPGKYAVRVNLDRLRGPQVKASWFDPRLGVSLPAGTYETGGVQEFTPPAYGPDWVLVLDAAD
jgi:hypothetical protein